MANEKTYEMMWDCEYCGQKKLLGKTHRHCPNCGAPQNPDKRYFPPEEEKVAVEDHEYVGADVECPACQFANSRAAKHCANCGSPLEEGKGVAVQQEVVVPDGGVPAPAPAPAQAPAAPEKGKSKAGLVGALIGIVLLCVIGFFVVRACWTTEAALKVTGHSWTRTIAIERNAPVKEKGPCAKMPKNATEVSRHKPEPVCKTRKIDQGDGTYKEKRECTEPQEQCEYTVTKWKQVRTEKASGNSVDDQLSWPTVKLERKGDCEGCEREAKRTETYTVHFVNTKTNDQDTCNFEDPSKWRSFKAGSQWAGKVGVIGGGIDCSALKAAP